ncbi:MAG: ATP phosphoribosyltransferase, partial [Algoriphagus sp. 32-45-6]
RLSLAIPKGQEYPGVQYFQGKSIATSYPKILGDFLQSKNIQAEIHEISGSVEIAPSIGLAEGIFDIVSSGSTLMMNGLKEVEEVFKSEAVLIGNKNLADWKKAILDKLLFRINAVQTGKSNKYVLMNVPNKSIPRIIELIPGMRSPTILPLAQEGWSSVHSVLSEDQFWENIEELRAAGAEGILVVPIEKMVL